MRRVFLIVMAVLGLNLSTARAALVHNPQHRSDLTGIDSVYSASRGNDAFMMLVPTGGAMHFDHVATNLARRPGDAGEVTDGANNMVAAGDLDDPGHSSPNGYCLPFGGGMMQLGHVAWWPGLEQPPGPGFTGHVYSASPALNTACSSSTSLTDQGQSDGSTPVSLTSTNATGLSPGDFVSICVQGQVHDGSGPTGDKSRMVEWRRTYNGSGSCSDTYLTVSGTR